MAYVTPASEVYIIKNCPLDIGREHTIKFATKTAQENYFFSSTRAEHHFGDYTRINPLDNSIRLGLSYAQVYQCNYVAFKNAASLQENKWYYGFITQVNYINEGTTEIIYSLDYMQTYLFDFNVMPCLVEREHTATDVVGDNIVPEGLDIGEYVFNRTHKNSTQSIYLNPSGYIPCNFGNQDVYIMITSRDLIQHYTQGLPWINLSIFYPVGNVFNGVGVYVIQDVETLSTVLSEMDTETGSIAAVFPFPASLIDWRCAHWGNTVYSISQKIARLYDDNGGTSVLAGNLETTVSYTDGTGAQHTPHTGFTIPKFRNEPIDGYLPWNNKLYTAPFCWVELDTKTGSTGLYRPELFGSTISFGFMSSPTAEPVIFAYPRYYRGIENNQEEGITKNNAYPYCAYQYEVFKAWLQQNRNSLALSFVLGATEGGISAAQTAIGKSLLSEGSRQTKSVTDYWRQGKEEDGTFGKEEWSRMRTKGSGMETSSRHVLDKTPGAILASSLSGLSKCAGTLTNIADHAMVPNTIKGQINNGSIVQANEINDFYVYIKTVRSDYAQKIDDFFSRYGYAINKFKVPNIFDTNGSPRRRWNYVKTVDAKITAKSATGFPLDVEQNLESILNRGITFWNITNGDMYDYTQTTNNNNKPSA